VWRIDVALHPFPAQSLSHHHVELALLQAAQRIGCLLREKRGGCRSSRICLSMRMGWRTSCWSRRYLASTARAWWPEMSPRRRMSSLRIRRLGLPTACEEKAFVLELLMKVRTRVRRLWRGRGRSRRTFERHCLGGGRAKVAYRPAMKAAL
jgi:hypothetical protein